MNIFKKLWRKLFGTKFIELTDEESYGEYQEFRRSELRLTKKGLKPSEISEACTFTPIFKFRNKREHNNVKGVNETDE